MNKILLLVMTISLNVFSADPSENSEWRLIGLNQDQHHFSDLDRINKSNVKDMGLAWSADMPGKDGLTGVPLVANGVIYQSGALGSVYANDVRSGKLLWEFKDNVKFPMGVIPSWGTRLSRGLAIWQDKIIRATGDCRLIALNAKTGIKVWESKSCNPENYKTITGAPRVGGGKVFIGNSNADSGVGRGFVDAFDVNTGNRLWRFYTIPGNPNDGFENDTMKMASKTWGEKYWEKSGGGSVWDAITYDEKLNLVYIGTDGPAPFDPSQRGDGRGDELFTNAIVALNADTGEYVWHYSTTPGDGWNYSATMHILIADLPFENGRRRVVMTAPKNGFFYILDARTGKFISAENIVPVTWASHIDTDSGRPVLNPGARYWDRKDKITIVSPSSMGAHNWMPMSYSPQTGLVYIPVMEMQNSYEHNPANSVGGIDIDFYYSLNNKHSVFKGSLLAWDPVRQKEIWRKDIGRPYNGGTLATAGGVVFQGSTDGKFTAYDDKTGDTLWSIPVPGGILAAPSTVLVDGEQLVIVPTGTGTTSAVGFASKLSGDAFGEPRLLAFKLSGEERMPVNSMTNQPFLKPPLPRANKEAVQRGKQIWDLTGCELCHGFQVAGGSGSVPDLRRSNKLTFDIFSGIVLGGAYFQKGMPIFHKSISIDHVDDLKAYIIDKAWDAYDKQGAKKY